MSTLPRDPAQTVEELLDALRAVREAIDIPHGATMGDQETRNAILTERTGHAVAMLSSIFDRIGDGRDPDITWSTTYLRERLAEHQPAGYKTWAERVAELKGTQAAIPATA